MCGSDACHMSGRAGSSGDWDACRTKVSERRSITAALQRCLQVPSPGRSGAKKKRVDKVFHQPAKKSLVDYESSEARIAPARQQEENAETEKREKSF